MAAHNENSAARIATAAVELFARKGYEATSVSEICAAAGITKPTLYYFYKNKEGVYRALVKTAAEEFYAFIDEGMREEGDLCKRYKAVVRILFRDARRRPKLWRFIFGLVWSAPNAPFAKHLYSLYETAVGNLGRAAREAAQRGDIAAGDVNLRMLVLMGAIGEALSGFLILGRPKLTPRLADSLIDTIFDGWTRRPNGKS